VRISVDVNVGENPSPPNGIVVLAFYDECDARMIFPFHSAVKRESQC
jgi:hypothetical protein